MDFRIGHGYDVHALAEGLPLVLGGVEIAHTKGCVAHSDGDVVIHALCDALLGAAALGDIGMHFPDTSDEFKGIDSKILLRKVAALLREKGYEIGNADCTIRAQRPKLRPHIDAMRTAMAGAMGVGGQSHDHGTAGLRGTGGGHLRLRRGADLQKIGCESPHERQRVPAGTLLSIRPKTAGQYNCEIEPEYCTGLYHGLVIVRLAPPVRENISKVKV